MSGYLKLQRKFFSHWLWEEERTFSKAEAWLYLLQFAAFAPTKRIVKGKLIELDEGECIASARYLGECWGWSKDKVSRYLKVLEFDHMISRAVRQGESVITLCNYRDCMSCETAECDSNEPETSQRRARDEPNKKKDKKDKKDKNVPTTFSGFLETLWSICPQMGKNRSSKRKLANAWKALNPKPSEDEVIKGMQAWKRSSDWLKDDGQYIKALDGWVRDRKWEEPPEPSKQEKAQEGKTTEIQIGDRSGIITNAGDL